MKAIPCKVIVNTRMGHECAPCEFPSIAKGIKYGKHEAAGFAYRIIADGKLVRRGFCDEP